MLISQNVQIIKDLSEEFGYLPYMIERYLDFLGLEGTLKLLEANELQLKPSIRVNTLKISPDKLRDILEKKDFQLEPIKKIPCGFKVLNNSQKLGSLHEFLQGFYYLQNMASMLPPLILNPKPNEVVIDMCAAPGSKSTHLAQIMNNKGTLILIEKNLQRIAGLTINIRRMGVLNSIIYNDDAINVSKFGIKVDKILLDAPCTGEGLIRQDPTRKKSKKLIDLEKLSNVQMSLLKAGINSLKKGGKLLYSTCSIAPEENEFVISNMLQNNPEISIIKIKEQYGVEGLTRIYGKSLNESLKFSQRIYPHLHDTIGFYLCLLRKDY